MPLVSYERGVRDYQHESSTDRRQWQNSLLAKNSKKTLVLQIAVLHTYIPSLSTCSDSTEASFTLGPVFSSKSRVDCSSGVELAAGLDACSSLSVPPPELSLSSATSPDADTDDLPLSSTCSGFAGSFFTLLVGDLETG